MSNGSQAEYIRCFVALELPSTVLQLLVDLQSQLRRQGAALAVRWTNPEGIHLTLKFLGNVEAARIPEIEQVLDQASSQTPPLELRVEGLGAFPSPKRPRVLWAGMTGDLEELRTLQQGIEDRLVGLGFSKEREFMPHLTLGRVKEKIRPNELATIQQLLERWTDFRSEPFIINEVSLIRSVLTPAGAQYSRLYAVPFTRDHQKQRG